MRLRATTLALAAALFLVPEALRAQTDSPVPRRAVQGERIAISQNHIKADKRADFEEYLRVFWSGAEAADAAGKLSETDKAAYRSVRVLFPVEAEADGTYTYTFVAGPFISEADYNTGRFLRANHPEERVQEIVKLYNGAIARKQMSLYGVQERR